MQAISAGTSDGHSSSEDGRYMAGAQELQSPRRNAATSSRATDEAEESDASKNGRADMQTNDFLQRRHFQ